MKNMTTLRAMLAGAAALVAAVSLAAAGAAQASALPTLSLTLTKSSITVAGATQSGGVNVVSTATGVKEANVILFLLKPGATFDEVEAAVQKDHGDTNVTSKYGSIVFDAEVTPGHSSEAQTYLQPGQYVALLPGGEGKGSKAHALFTVTAAASPVALPTPQATIRSIEFGFRGPSTLHDGELVRFENEGFLVHMDVAAPVKNMKAAKEVVKDLLAGKEKAFEKLISGPPAGLPGRFHTKPSSRRRSQPSPASMSRSASWTPRTGAVTPSWGWSESSRSRSRDRGTEPRTRQAPARGEELDPLLGPVVADHACVEALAEDIEHRAIFGENLGHEARDATPLGDDRQPLDQDRAEALAMQVVGDLDGDFGARRQPGLGVNAARGASIGRGVQPDVGGVPDDRADVVVCDQTVAISAGGGGQVRRVVEVGRSGEEPQAPGLQAQPGQEQIQRRLVRGGRGAQRHRGAIAQPDQLCLARTHKGQ